MKVGILAGSFNPWHLGHQSILEQSLLVFDKIIVVVAQNPIKPLISSEDLASRISAIQSINQLDNVSVVALPRQNFLTDLIREEQKYTGETFLIRGIRNSQDWAAEANQLEYLRGLYPELKTIYFSCSKELEHISSSGIRMMQAIQSGSGDKYLVAVK